MAKQIKIGILRETKIPTDKRVPVTPSQVVLAEEKFPDVKFCVQPSDLRCFTNLEYEYLKVPFKEDLSGCDILVGVKEVDKTKFIEGKTYIFFAHVAKKQAHNRPMFQEMMRKKITLIDYEYLTHPEGQRVIAFGHWAGVVGAYNALRAKGLQKGTFKLKPAHECHDMEEMYAGLHKIKLQPKKILVTGEGRVAHGALQTLNELKIKKVNVDEFLTKTFDEPVLCQIGPKDYVNRKDGKPFDFNYFVQHPAEHTSNFTRFSKVTDILITCHFWDEKSPVFLTKEDYRHPDFRISVIADVSCDINGPLPSTLRSSTVADPFYGYNPETEKEEKAFSNPKSVTVMAVDNLPCELPRDASKDFGEMFVSKVIPHFFNNDEFGVIERATILKNGEITPRYKYLQKYSLGEE
jgi:alanine dehydrogenase